MLYLGWFSLYKVLTHYIMDFVAALFRVNQASCFYNVFAKLTLPWLLPFSNADMAGVYLNIYVCE